jgi:phage protein D
MMGLAKASQWAEAVTGEGTLDVLRYGRILKARQLVGVRGAGKAFDGLHYVTSVTHKIQRGSYKQSFQLSRNGLISTIPAVIP